jgi:lipopolysaccharide/colanic/teichoic acid biosynthesis glycosyltransferase
MNRTVSGKRITEPDDNRITTWGRVLRSLKLDEMPQLLNIVKGDMVFVGPRPEVPEYVNTKQFKFLNVIRPGLSDFASILLRDESRILMEIRDQFTYHDLLRLKCDIADYYVQRKMGYITDITIVIYTAFSIIFPQIINKSFIIPQLKNDLPQWSGFIEKHCI